MKRLSALFAILAVMLVASMVSGEVKDFESFTVEVPDNWTAMPDGTTVDIIKDDNTALVSITVESMEGISLKELAEAYAEGMNASNITPDGDSYTFEAENPNGVSMKCFLSGDGTNYALIVVTGLENAADEVSAIVDSLQEK